ncbi:MAG: hemerythrin domain-containing protein [Telluria sp.]
MARDILKTLSTEHGKVRSLFEEIKATTDRAEKGRGTLLNDILAALVPHAKWEELVFYPAFEARADREGLKTHAEAVEEHRAVELTVIPDVNKSDLTTPQFAGRVKVFAEFIDHHAKEEEKTMFKMAREMFSADEREQFDVDYETWKTSSTGKTVVAQAMKEMGARMQ